MNPEDNFPHADSEPVLSTEIPGKRSFDWNYWARRLLVCNPFFLGSAALLLLGINRLSINPNFLGDDTQNLLFNFFALQCYEGLVVVTAIFLARRRVWYDSALLIVLDNGLVLVPFMLISQAALIGGALSWTLAVAGGAMALGRIFSVRRWFPQFNLPPRALLLGSIILVANMALPRVFRPLMEVDVENWRGPNLVCWYFVLPLLAAGANLLPRPSWYGGRNPERHWLPLFNYALWVAGSAVHVWCVAHICGLPFELTQIAPLALVATWTMRNRLDDCLPNPSRAWQDTLLGLTLGTPLLAVGTPSVYLSLVGANIIGYAWLYLRSGPKTRRLVLHLLLAAIALFGVGLPVEWGQMLRPNFGRLDAWKFSAVMYFLFLACISRRPVIGLTGAFAFGCFAGGLAPVWPRDIATQAGLGFLLVHSLGWPAKAKGWLKFTVMSAALVWALHGLLWTRTIAWVPVGAVLAIAFVVMAAWLVAWRLQKQWGMFVIPIAASICLCSPPLHWLRREGPDGMLAMAGSLVLFALGTIVAWTRHHWEPTRAAPEKGLEGD